MVNDLLRCGQAGEKLHEVRQSRESGSPFGVEFAQTTAQNAREALLAGPELGGNVTWYLQDQLHVAVLHLKMGLCLMDV